MPSNRGPVDPHNKVSERWYRKLARTEVVTVNGQDYTLQSVSPRWYYETNDKCGMSGDRKDTVRYMDTMFRNVVIAPAAVAQTGLAYFDEQEDVETPELLIREIEKFLRPGKRSGGSGATGREK